MRMISLSLLALISSCGQMPSLPSSADGVLAEDNTASSQPVVAATIPSPAPSPSPRVQTPPNLDGTYHFVHSSCGSVLSYPLPITHTLTVLAGKMDVYDMVSGCNATLRRTIEYNISYDNTLLSMSPSDTLTYGTPGDCFNPVDHAAVNVAWTQYGYALQNGFLGIASNNNCDGNGTHSVTVYQKE